MPRTENTGIKKVKVVLIVSEDLRDQVKQIVSKDSEEVLIIGDGIKAISEADLYKIQGITDENTLFILSAHGARNPDDNSHFIEINNGFQNTQSFLQQLQAIAGHKITANLASCHGGASLKVGDLDGEKISVLTEVGSKHSSDVGRGTISINQAINQKLLGKTNEEIFSIEVGSNPETMYYVPLAEKKVKIDGSKLNFFEIEEILRDVYGASSEDSLENINKMISDDIGKFKDLQKTEFSLNEIKTILKLSVQARKKLREEKNDKSAKFNNALEVKFINNLFSKNTLARKLNKPRYKFSRPGKFTSSEIEDILEKTYRETKPEASDESILEFMEEDLAKISLGKNSVNSDFTLHRIKKALELTEQDLAKKELDTATLEFKNNLLKNLRQALQDKLSEAQIKSHLQKRRDEFNEITGVKNSNEPIDGRAALADFWYTASFRGHEEEISAILKNHPNYINEKHGTDKTTALIRAAQEGHYLAIKVLIASDANVNEVNKFGESALMYAAMKGHMNIAKELLRAGININLASKDGSALIYAIKGDHLEVARELIKAGADVNIEGRFHPPLVFAAQTGDFEFVKLLIEKGASKGINKALEEAVFLKENYVKFQHLENKTSENKPPEYDKIIELLKTKINEEKIGTIHTKFNFENITARDMKEIVDILKENKSQYNNSNKYYDLIDKNDQNIPLISRLLLSQPDEKVLTLLNENLDLFINEKNLSEKDSQNRTPLSIAINKAASTKGNTKKLLVQIATKQVMKMESPDQDKNKQHLIDNKIAEHRGIKKLKMSYALRKVLREVNKELKSKGVTNVKVEKAKADKSKTEINNKKPNPNMHAKESRSLKEKVKNLLKI